MGRENLHGGTEIPMKETGLMAKVMEKAKLLIEQEINMRASTAKEQNMGKVFIVGKINKGIQEISFKIAAKVLGKSLVQE